mmetsp:Transcript_118316/g.339529  ORF Transcript_118316/g.339529 Transcript_118316/m.339529 type:complete len:217 (+) Transcript_118316:609-1259(+)
MPKEKDALLPAGFRGLCLHNRFAGCGVSGMERSRRRCRCGGSGDQRRWESRKLRSPVLLDACHPHGRRHRAHQEAGRRRSHRSGSTDGGGRGARRRERVRSERDLHGGRNSSRRRRDVARAADVTAIHPKRRGTRDRKRMAGDDLRGRGRRRDSGRARGVWGEGGVGGRSRRHIAHRRQCGRRRRRPRILHYGANGAQGQHWRADCRHVCGRQSMR